MMHQAIGGRRGTGDPEATQCENEQSEQGLATGPVRGGKREIDVWGIICWAFQNECVSLDRHEEETGLEQRVNVDPIYQMAEIARLGCRVQGGGRSASHHDADIVAATLAVLPDGCGGWHMATAIAELARAGITPDWHRNPQVVPVDTVTNRYGHHAKTADAKQLGSIGWPHQSRRNRKGRTVYDPVLFTPVVIRPSAAQVTRSRRAYLDWYGALLDIRSALQHSVLTSFIVTDRMPARAPWKNPA